MQIRNVNNTVVANYEYDAWGKVVSIKYANGNDINVSNHIGVINPIRYRGYYYDSETGFYYLKSRYYDPAICRFISTDGRIDLNDATTNLNLFAYCGNDPVNRADPSGDAWYHWVLGAAVVAACAVATVATCGGFAAAAASVCMVASGTAAASTAATVATSALIGSATVYGTAAVSAAMNSSSLDDFADQGDWGTVATTAGGGVFYGIAAYASTRTPTTKIYRSVGNEEAQDIKNTGQFNLSSTGMDCKQFGFNLSETREFGNKMQQSIIVSAKIPKSMLGQLYTGGVDTSIFRAGTLTVYGDQLWAFNQAVSGTIRFIK